MHAREVHSASMFRFAHASDLHLDSPFRGLVDVAPHVAAALRQATFDAYEAIIDLCIERDVDALLVAGDVFDGADRSLKAQRRFVDGLQRLNDAAIRAFICHGNHDPLDGWEATIPFPDNVHRFGAEVECVPLVLGDPSSPVVCGVSYPTREVRESLLPQFPAHEPHRYTIGLMHANVGANRDHDAYAPCSLQDLQATGYDYWALGHVHTRQVLHEQSPTVVYPGNTQGRHPNERGARGVYIVELSGSGTTALEFVAVDTVRWERIEVAIDEIDDDGVLAATLEQHVADAVRAAGGRHLVSRLRLTGRGPLHESLARADYIEDLREQLNELWVARQPFAFCGQIENATALPINREELSRGQDFVGDFLRLVDETRDDEDMVGELQRELAALYEHNRARRYLRDELPSLDEIRALIAGAENLALSGLLEREP